MTDIQIAPATPAHLPKILEQTRATYQEHRARNPKAFPEKTYLKLVQRHEQALEQHETEPLCFVASDDGALCGFVLLRPVFGAAMVYDIGVFPSFRRRRIGHALVAHVVQVALQRDWDVLFAAVWDGNDASHALFKSHGFLGRRSGFIARFRPKSRSTAYVYDLKKHKNSAP